MTEMRVDMRGPQGLRSQGVPERACDWASVASLLAESDPRPLLVLDGEAIVRLCNPALEQLLGWSRERLVGRPWTELCARQDDADVHPVEAVLRGARRRMQCEVPVEGGPHLRLSLELSHFGHGGAEGVLAVVSSVTRFKGPLSAGSERSRVYVICSRIQDFGTIRVAYDTGSRQSELEGQRCFQVLHQRNTPCSSCPVLVGAQEGWPRTAVFRCHEQAHGFQLITAEPLDADHTRLSVQLLSDALFRQLVHAKVRALALASGLSERERRVFELLVSGCELKDMADQLGISVRTVKFHQANLLRKLEVDSRAALLRLIL
ncbi:MAG TPA: LuxR C-terminal-related transcriptional regulator [Myxococcaceae bacterium]|nr:LuxR C-terminal-related transcriptional regulator [Myxococcaceae bacterium]